MRLAELTNTTLEEEAQAVIDRAARTFSLAARLLPPRVRADVNLLYLIVRELDDAVDERDLDAAERLRCVRDWATWGTVASRDASRLEILATRHPQLPRDAVVDFCRGQERDLNHKTFATERELDDYCYCVAGTVGRLMACLLGARGSEADQAARALGIAMQRTNILRDLDEDWARGVVYLPRESLALAGVEDLGLDDRSLLLRVEVGIAEWWYDRGLAGLHLLPEGRMGVRVAAVMYRDLLRQLARDGWGRRRPWRAHLSSRRRALLLARSLVL